MHSTPLRPLLAALAAAALPAAAAMPEPAAVGARQVGPGGDAGLASAGAATQTDGAGLSASVLDEGLVQEVQNLALAGAAQSPAADGPAVRFEVEAGVLDPRLKLAPCQRIQPYLPAGARPWGKSRIGLRCVQGPTPWNVFLPVTVKAWTPGWVAASALPAGTAIDATKLMSAEVDLAAGAGSAVVLLDASVVGRTLTHPLAAGAALRTADLKPRQWFAAGDTVRVLAGGPGFEIATEAQALGPGVEGQTVRVRTEAGRVLQGRAAGDRLVDTRL